MVEAQERACVAEKQFVVTKLKEEVLSGLGVRVQDTHISIYLYRCIYIYKYIYIYMCIYMYIYICV